MVTCMAPVVHDYMDMVFALAMALRSITCRKLVLTDDTTLSPPCIQYVVTNGMNTSE